MITHFCLVGTLATAAAAPGRMEPPTVLATWSFERSEAATGGPRPLEAKRVAGQSNYSDDVPGQFIYDPITGKSRPNTASAVFQGSDRKSDAIRAKLNLQPARGADASVTIELFIKPDAEARGDAWLAGQRRLSEAGSELSLQAYHVHNHHVTFLGGGFVPPRGRGERAPAGHYSSSARLHREYHQWRHMAIVHDAKAKTVTCWCDYHLSRRFEVATPLVFDKGDFLIGGAPDHWGVAGLIDEVRVTRGALQPALFLRARNDAIKNVTFVSDQTIAPRDAGCLDVKEHFGAVGDGKTDDTAAFNAAFKHLTSKVPLAYNTLLLPAGEYLVSDMLWCSRFIDVKGAGPERTVIRLKDGVFTDPQKPKPVLRMSSTSGDPGSHSWTNGSSISIYLDGLTIDTGKNNPGAKALEYHSNNLGRLENVVLRSGDGAGVMGLDLMHHDVGPSLVKHVTVEGFDVGGGIRYQEYSMTFEHVVFKNQRVVGIRNQGNILAIRKLRSENKVPAIVCEGANSMLTLLDSELTGGADDAPAIKADGAVYLARIKTAGYAKALSKRTLVNQKATEWTESELAGPTIDEYIGDKIVKGFGDLAGALKLPIEETPTPAVPPVDEWVSVAKFKDKKLGDNGSPVVQAAIDSGARVIYFPRDFPLELKSPIWIRGEVERLVGFGGELNWAQGMTPKGETPAPLLIFDQPDAARVVVLDRLGCAHLQHASPATLVLRSSSVGRYTTAKAVGRLFAEDIGGADWHFDHPQHVWVRQWNPESHEAGPCIHSKGATIWALGFKTEYESQKLLAEAGASTEILGSFIYPLGKIPPDRPIFENRDSRMSLVYGASVYHSNHKVHVRDLSKKEVKEFGGDALKWAGSRARMDLFISDGR